MNGMAASDKLFKLLDTEEDKRGTVTDVDFNNDIVIKNLSFSYDDKNQCLTKSVLLSRNISLQAL